MSKLNPKIPPQDIEAEYSVLGSLMLDKNAIIKVADLLSTQDFYKPAHKIIYECVLELFEKNSPVDIITVTGKLKDKNALDEVGGSSYLTELISSVPSSAHIVHYAEIVKQKKVLRELLTTSAQISEEVFQNQEDPEDLLDLIEQKIFAISQKSKNYSFTPIRDHLVDAYERFEKNHQMGGAPVGVTSGFKQLDHILSGYQKSDLIILGARPSMGKTAVTLDMARAAAKSGKSVAYFSLEMSKEQIIDRIISAEAQIPLWKLRNGRLDNELDFQMIQAALDRLQSMNIFIDDTPSPTVLQIKSMSRRLQMEHGLDIIIIDYVQLIMPSRHSENVVQQFTEISHGLKALSRELNVPLIALSQLNRAVDAREVKIPRLSDLRETGSWEQDADVVMFIYRPDKDKLTPSLDETERNKAQIHVAKHRNGPLGVVDLQFDPEKVSFVEVDTMHTQDYLPPVSVEEPIIQLPQEMF